MKRLHTFLFVSSVLALIIQHSLFASGSLSILEHPKTGSALMCLGDFHDGIGGVYGAEHAKIVLREMKRLSSKEMDFHPTNCFIELDEPEVEALKGGNENTLRVFAKADKSFWDNKNDTLFKFIPVEMRHCLLDGPDLPSTSDSLRVFFCDVLARVALIKKSYETKAKNMPQKIWETIYEYGLNLAKEDTKEHITKGHMRDISVADFCKHVKKADGIINTFKNDLLRKRINTIMYACLNDNGEVDNDFSVNKSIGTLVYEYLNDNQEVAGNQEVMIFLGEATFIPYDNIEIVMGLLIKRYSKASHNILKWLSGVKNKDQSLFDLFFKYIRKHAHDFDELEYLLSSKDPRKLGLINTFLLDFYGAYADICFFYYIVSGLGKERSSHRIIFIAGEKHVEAIIEAFKGLDYTVVSRFSIPYKESPEDLGGLMGKFSANFKKFFPQQLEAFVTKKPNSIPSELLTSSSSNSSSSSSSSTSSLSS